MTEAVLGPLTELTFTPERTRAVLDAACEALGTDPAGASLLRHQTNAVYKLGSAPIVVKIARPGVQHTSTVVRLVRWLTDHNVPSVPLHQGVDQPLSLGGCAVTFWRYLPQARPITAGDIAGPLAALHAAPSPPLTLPELNPIGAIERSLRANRVLTGDEVELLRDRCRKLAAELSLVRFTGRRTLVHGDAQHRNTLLDPNSGQAVLCDWESAAIGPPEWDLVTIEIHCRRFGHAPQEFDDFCDRYGFDVREWSGYRVLRDVKELRMITTNARKSVPGSPQAVEVRRRVGILNGGPTQGWQIL